MKNVRVWILTVLGLMIVLAVGLSLRNEHSTLTNSGKKASGHQLQVTATFYPMAEFARQVGGDKVTVTTLVKPGVEPHDYDPSPRDVAAIYKSKLLIYNGGGLEAWVGKLQNDLQKQGVTVVQASDGIELRPGDSGSPQDPHVWMDPVLAIQEVKNIQQALAKVDPSNAKTYNANADKYIQQLTKLDSEFRSGLARCQLTDIITSHQAFKYLAKEYGLNTVGIAGLSPDDEPSPRQMAQAVDFVRQNDIHYIFFESLVSPKLAQSIADETGAQSIVFNPLEGLTQAELDLGQNYITVQQGNLQALRTALSCQ